MTATSKVAVNPLPWIFGGPESFDLSRATIIGAVRGVAESGFSAIHADVPADMSAAEYAALIADHGLRPAPGYFSAEYDVSAADLAQTVEAAKRHAAVQLELGMTEVFLASHLTPARIAEPAVGAAFSASRLAQVIDAIGATAAAITAEGLRPCFHPHVGSWIETEDEIRSLLGTVGPDTLAFGPDTGHLYWAGADPLTLIGEFADRVGAIHIKDVHRSVVHAAREQKQDYWQATFGSNVWTEPGRGDVALDTILAAVPASYEGWFVVEVDVPDGLSKEESTATSAHWVDSQTRFGAS